MPLPPVADNATSRIFVDYVTSSNEAAVEHTFVMRYVSGSYDAPGVQDRVYAFLTGIGADSLWAGWKVLAVRAQQAGTDITLPMALGNPLASFVGTAAGFTAKMNPYEARFQGRSPTTGRRVSLSIYGIAATTPYEAYRLLGGTGGVAWVTSAVAALNGDDTSYITKDGSRATWSAYVNLNFNSYWERRARLG